MILSIDTGKKDRICLGLESEPGKEQRICLTADFDQAEKLLPAISAFLEERKIALSELQVIKVNDRGDSFTALRIGVVTANALAYALNIPVKPWSGQDNGRFVRPEYASKPNISQKKLKNP